MRKKQVIMDLVGRVAMVGDDTGTRLLSRKGECCIIQDIRSEIPSERIIVSFEDGKVDYIKPGDLLLLRPKREILESIISSTENMTKEDYKNLLKVIQLQTEKKPVQALQLAMSRECYINHCVINCQEWVLMKETQRLKKFKQNGKRI